MLTNQQINQRMLINRMEHHLFNLDKYLNLNFNSRHPLIMDITIPHRNRNNL